MGTYLLCTVLCFCTCLEFSLPLLHAFFSTSYRFGLARVRGDNLKGDTNGSHLHTLCLLSLPPGTRPFFLPMLATPVCLSVNIPDSYCTCYKSNRSHLHPVKRDTFCRTSTDPQSPRLLISIRQQGKSVWSWNSSTSDHRHSSLPMPSLG